MKKVFKYLNSIDKNLLIIFISSLVILWPLVSGHYMRGHDSFYHYANIFALDSGFNFSLFNLLPSKILPIIAYGFGWGEGIFYPSFPHYFAVYIYKIFSIVGVSNVFTSMKICHFIILFLSGITIYYLCIKIFGDKKAGLVAAIIYMTYPYHYIDIFVRDAFSECFMFVFVPLIFLGLEFLFEGNYRKFYIFFIIGYVGTIFCHLVLTIYLTLLVVVYLLLNYKKTFKKSVIKALVIAGILIFMITLPFTLPLAEHTIFGNYTVYIDGLMYSLESLKNTAVNFTDYFSRKRPLAWTGDLVFTISFPAFFLLILVIFKSFILKMFNKISKYFICLILVVLFMSPYFPWEKLPSFFGSIQFLWRLNLFLAFFLSICVSSVVLFYKEKTNIVIIIIVIISSFVMMWNFNSMAIFDTFDTSNIDVSKSGAASFQYIPAKSYNHLNYVKKRKYDVAVVHGEAKIDKLVSSVPNMSFHVKTKGCILELPRYYFIGYKITLNDKKIKYKENKRGFIEIKLKHSGKIIVSYNGTFGYKIACILSVCGIILLIIILYFDKIKLLIRKKE